MSVLLDKIINKYHSVAPQRVIHAVEKAAARTGADFSFLMEKASAESGFNPNAKARTSTATGLFQFIDNTWLHMVKDYGAKYGLGAFARQIEIRNGRPCVENCQTRDAILNLRRNPEISALMAGEFSARNKQYLEDHTGGAVGATELSLAHFMGAAGAAKFLNRRDENGAAAAAQLFPKEARANKNVFFDATTGQARTLNAIYDLLAQKFDNGAGTGGRSLASSSSSALSLCTLAEDGSTPAPAQSTPSLTPIEIAQALPSFSDAPGAADMLRTDAPHSTTGFFRPRAAAPQKLSMDNILFMAQLHQAMPQIKSPYRS